MVQMFYYEQRGKCCRTLWKHHGRVLKVSAQMSLEADSFGESIPPLNHKLKEKFHPTCHFLLPNCLGIKDGSGSDVAVARTALPLRPRKLPSGSARSPHLISGKLFPEATKVLLSSSAEIFGSQSRGCVNALLSAFSPHLSVCRVSPKWASEVA